MRRSWFASTRGTIERDETIFTIPLHICIKIVCFDEDCQCACAKITYDPIHKKTLDILNLHS